MISHAVHGESNVFVGVLVTAIGRHCCSMLVAHGAVFEFLQVCVPGSCEVVLSGGGRIIFNS